MSDTIHMLNDVVENFLHRISPDDEWLLIYISQCLSLEEEYRNKGLHWEADLFAEIAEDFIQILEDFDSINADH